MDHANSKYDVKLDFDTELTPNKYRNRRNIREMLNTISKASFEKSKKESWNPCIKADMHVIDRLCDREFPLNEFLQIVAKVVTTHESQLLELVNARFNKIDFNPLRINCYGYGSWMIGISISIHSNPEANVKSYHVNIRTCYAERNMCYRERQVEVKKIWTRGKPKWLKRAESEKLKEGKVNEI